MSGDWDAYYAATAGRPPRRTLLWALDQFVPQPAAARAADIGCGDGRDTIELLRRGWEVIAIDAEPRALERLAQRPDLPQGARLTPCRGRFEEVGWPEVDLVNASFALPLCPAAEFPALWRKIARSLKAGGRFAGQLYGTRDSWAADRAMMFFDEADARRLFDGYAIEMFDIEESDSVTPRGSAKHWHIFHIVARRR